MKTNIEVKRNVNETPISLIRRFSRQVKSANVLQKVRANRFFSRKNSHLKTKSRTLNGIEKRKEYDRLKKLGKIPS